MFDKASFRRGLGGGALAVAFGNIVGLAVFPQFTNSIIVADVILFVVGLRLYLKRS